MPDDMDVTERMERYAKAAARKVLLKLGLEQDESRHEDISQTLFLAGWEVWSDTGDWEKAKHRMSDRAKNESKKLHADLGVKQFDEEQPDARYGCDDDADATERYQHEPRAPAPRVMRVQVRSSAEEDQRIQEYLDGLSDLQRRIVELTLVPMDKPGSKKGLTEQQMAKELGIPLRTLQREKERIRQHRKEYDLDDE